MDAKEIREKVKAALLAAKGIADAVDEAKRDFTAEERNQVKGYLEEAKTLREQLKSLEDDAAMRQQILDFGMGLEVKESSDGKLLPGIAAGKGKSFGERFVEAEAFQNWLKQVAPNGQLPVGMKGIQSPPVEFKHLMKALITGGSDTSAGAFVETDYTGISEALGRRPRTLLDLIPRGNTTSDTIEFVRQTAQVTQAAVVPESNVTDYTGATGQVEGVKPEGTSTWEQVTENVKTIAVWIPATKQALSDAGQLRSLIDLELKEDLQECLEDEVYGGAGGSTHFTGIISTSGVLEQDWNTNLRTTTRKAKTAIMTTGRSVPTAWLMNPADVEAVELDADNYKERQPYYNVETGRLHGIPVVESQVVTEGQALLADWRKCRIWDREQATISVSDSHSDFFIRNMVAILCELRAAFGVIRPTAFIKVDLSATS